MLSVTNHSGRASDEDDDDAAWWGGASISRTETRDSRKLMMDSEDQPIVEDESDSNSDIANLTQWWINERFSPEILEYQQVLVDSLIEMLELQTGIVDDMDKTVRGAAFLKTIYQMEMERIKFVIRSYLRTRLEKIEKMAQFIVANKDSRQKLSSSELAFAETYASTVKDHYIKTCLDTLAEQIQRLDDTSDGNMVVGPDFDKPVFCIVRESIGPFQLSERLESIDMQKNDIYLLRYKSIRRLLESRKVDLI